MKTTQSALQLARAAGRMALAKKGFDVRILNLKTLSSICDYFVIVSGEADVHVKAIARAIVDGITELDRKPRFKEGLNEGNWVLLDFGDVIVHVFQEPTRQFYALERLWGDAPVEELSDD